MDILTFYLLVILILFIGEATSIKISYTHEINAHELLGCPGALNMVSSTKNKHCFHMLEYLVSIVETGSKADVVNYIRDNIAIVISSKFHRIRVRIDEDSVTYEDLIHLATEYSNIVSEKKLKEAANLRIYIDLCIYVIQWYLLLFASLLYYDDITRRCTKLFTNRNNVTLQLKIFNESLTRFFKKRQKMTDLSKYQKSKSAVALNNPKNLKNIASFMPSQPIPQNKKAIVIYYSAIYKRSKYKIISYTFAFLKCEWNRFLLYTLKYFKWDLFLGIFIGVNHLH